jgi:hypothetical protein
MLAIFGTPGSHCVRMAGSVSVLYSLRRANLGGGQEIHLSSLGDCMTNVQNGMQRRRGLSNTLAAFGETQIAAPMRWQCIHMLNAKA